MRGRDPVDEYVRLLLRSGQKSAAATLARLVGLVEERGTAVPMPWARLIDPRERIYELRPGDHRVAYADHAGQIVLLHAWRKQSQHLDRTELERARSRLEDWRKRHPK